ncbi:hypothetical protein MIDIC_470012 [Alphaproteobacteria bacterium]
MLNNEMQAASNKITADINNMLALMKDYEVSENSHGVTEDLVYRTVLNYLSKGHLSVTQDLNGFVGIADQTEFNEAVNQRYGDGDGGIKQILNKLCQNDDYTKVIDDGMLSIPGTVTKLLGYMRNGFTTEKVDDFKTDTFYMDKNGDGVGTAESGVYDQNNKKLTGEQIQEMINEGELSEKLEKTGGSFDRHYVDEVKASVKSTMQQVNEANLNGVTPNYCKQCFDANIGERIKGIEGKKEQLKQNIEQRFENVDDIVAKIQKAFQEKNPDSLKTGFGDLKTFCKNENMKVSYGANGFTVSSQNNANNDKIKECFMSTIGNPSSHKQTVKNKGLTQDFADLNKNIMEITAYLRGEREALPGQDEMQTLPTRLKSFFDAVDAPQKKQFQAKVQEEEKGGFKAR